MLVFRGILARGGRQREAEVSAEGSGWAVMLQHQPHRCICLINLDSSVTTFHVHLNLENIWNKVRSRTNARRAAIHLRRVFPRTAVAQ